MGYAPEQEAILEALLDLLKTQLPQVVQLVDQAALPQLANPTPAPQTIVPGEPTGLSPWPQVAVIPQGWNVHSDDEFVRTLDYQFEFEARVSGPDPQTVTRYMLRYAKALDHILRENQAGPGWKAITVREARNSPVLEIRNSGLAQMVSLTADVRAVLA